MYSTKAGLVLGFHGCEEKIGLDIINHKKPMKFSSNKYDWLGRGLYFWEHSPSRAKEYIEYKKANPIPSKTPIIKPFVLGAVIDLQRCFDLTDFDNLKEVQAAYKIVENAFKKAGLKMPANKNVGGNRDLLLRDLDCYVINTVHILREISKLPPYDSIRGIFVEGDELYDKAGFKSKNHIQLCVLNPNCIKGFFIPRKLEKFP